MPMPFLIHALAHLLGFIATLASQAVHRARRATRYQWLVGSLAVLLVLSAALNGFWYLHRHRHPAYPDAAATDDAFGDSCKHRLDVLARLGDAAVPARDVHHREGGGDEDGDDAFVEQACWAHQMVAAFSCRVQNRGNWTLATPSSPAMPARLPPSLGRLVATYFGTGEDPSFSLGAIFNLTVSPSSAYASSSIAPALHALMRHAGATSSSSSSRDVRDAVAEFVVVAQAAAAVLRRPEGYEDWFGPAREDFVKWRVGSGWWGVCDGLGDVSLGARRARESERERERERGEEGEEEEEEGGRRVDRRDEL